MGSFKSTLSTASVRSSSWKRSSVSFCSVRSSMKKKSNKISPRCFSESFATTMCHKSIEMLVLYFFPDRLILFYLLRLLSHASVSPSAFPFFSPPFSLLSNCSGKKSIFSPWNKRNSLFSRLPYSTDFLSNKHHHKALLFVYPYQTRQNSLACSLRRNSPCVVLSAEKNQSNYLSKIQVLVRNQRRDASFSLLGSLFSPGEAAWCVSSLCPALCRDAAFKSSSYCKLPAPTQIHVVYWSEVSVWKLTFADDIYLCGWAAGFL